MSSGKSMDTIATVFDEAVNLESLRCDSSEKPKRRVSGGITRSDSSVHRTSITADENPLVMDNFRQQNSDEEDYAEIHFAEDKRLSSSQRQTIIGYMDGGSKRVLLFDVMFQFEIDCDDSPSSSPLSSHPLGIATEELYPSVIVVTRLIRDNFKPGPAERVGIRVGDVIFGVNYKSTANATPSTVDGGGHRMRAEDEKLETSKSDDVYKSSAKQIVYLQCWRSEEICTEDTPGVDYIGGEYSVVFQSYNLAREDVLTREEQARFQNILLDYIKYKSRNFFSPSKNSHGSLESVDKAVENASYATTKTETEKKTKSSSRRQSLGTYDAPGKSNNYLFDMERNIIHAKGLRPVLCARVVSARVSRETTLYTLRVEDVESGHSWVTDRRFRDFFALQEQLLRLELSSRILDLVPALPAKVNLRKRSQVVEMRILGLEAYIRALVSTLSASAAMDRRASDALKLVQMFLGSAAISSHIIQRRVDDQRAVEVTVFRFLNDSSTKISSYCHKFITSTNLQDVAKSMDGYRGMLQHLNQACVEVCDEVVITYGDELYRNMHGRRPKAGTEKIKRFVYKCIRRQVESCIFLPLRRRTLAVMLNSVLLPSMETLALTARRMRSALPSFFSVPEEALLAPSLSSAVNALRDAFCAYLPLDQRLLLRSAAKIIVTVHEEVQTMYTEKKEANEAREIEARKMAAKQDGNGHVSSDEEIVESRPSDVTPFDENATSDDTISVKNAISADDFLPLFTFVLSRVGIPQMLLYKEIILNVGDDSDALGEIGYYMATLEAACIHLVELAELL